MTQNRKAAKQLIMMFSMLLFLCTAGNIKAGDINNPDKAIPIETVSLSATEISEANILSVSKNTLLSFSIPQNEFVRVSIFDVNGREISVLVNDNKKAGEFSADLNKANLRNGTYYYRLVVGRYKEVRKLNIL